jgi:hypothetical protein
MTKLPKITNSQKTGKIAADLFSSVLSGFCNVIPVPQSHDVGIDFICEILEGSKPTGKLFNIQCKGTDGTVIDKSSIRISIKVETLNYWLLQPNPTFLVLVDCQNRCFYWDFPRIFLESYKENWQDKKTISIPISSQNNFDQDICSLPEKLVSIVTKYASAKPRIDYIGTLKLYYSSVIIDCIFINDAILETKKFYSELYPEKNLQIPNIYIIINELLKWSKLKSDSKIFCYLIRPNKNLYDLPGIVYPEELDENSEFSDEYVNCSLGENPANTEEEHQFIVNDFETNDFVWAEVESLVYRFANVEEVLLVAHDKAYSYLFKQMEQKGIKITWARYQFGFKTGFNHSDMYYYPLKWVNIMSVIANVMGLESHEL